MVATCRALFAVRTNAKICAQIPLLHHHAVLQVAHQTVAARQGTADEIGALTASKLKSELDLSFANVERAQAKLLLLDAEDASEDSIANLNMLLSSEGDEHYVLVDETLKDAHPAPIEIESMVQLAFTSRPDLGSLNERYNGARQFSAAEHALNCPTVSALAVVGGTPIRAGQIASSWYGAAGAIVSIPLFNGSRYSTRVCESAFKAKAAREEVRNLRESIARDVRASGFAAQTAFEWIGVTKQLLEQSSLALDLAQTRYKLGLSDIVELRHAQLAQTQGQIAYANALYASLEALAVLKFQTRQ